MKTTSNNYSVDFFINYYKSKPEHLWAIGNQDTLDGRHCALGWPNYHDKNYVMTDSLTRLFTGMSVRICKITSSNGNNIGQIIRCETRSIVAAINNGEAEEYQQETPKQRILAALYDIYEKTYGRKYQAGTRSKGKNRLRHGRLYRKRTFRTTNQ